MSAYPSQVLAGYDWRPAYWAATPERRRERNLPTPDRLPTAPRLIVIHSGSHGPCTAQWAWRPAAWDWAHFAWDCHGRRYVQTDYLDAWAPHAGHLNRFAWGIETPHHPGQGGDYRDQTVELVRRLAAEGATAITGHRFVDHGKRDPGEAVTSDWWDGLGLRVYWSWQGEGGGVILEAEGLRG